MNFLAGQNFKVILRQLGSDVGLNLRLPGGQIVVMYEPFGQVPEIGFSWVTETAGEYRVEVYARARAATARYEIRLAEVHPATANEHLLQAARIQFADYARLNRDSRFAESRVPLQRALAIREQVLGPDDRLVGETLAFLAANYSASGDFVNAEPLKLRALKILEARLGSNSPRVAAEWAEVGSLYLEKGDLARAEEVCRKALRIFESNGQTDDPVIAGAFGQLGRIYYQRSDYVNAAKYYELSRAAWGKLLGLDHFHMAPTYSYLGRVAYDSGDLRQAVTLFQRALELTEKGLGPNNTRLSRYLNDLGQVHCTTGDFATGESAYRRALAIFENRTALGQPEAQETLLGLARCSAAQGHLTEAIQMQTRANEIAERFVALNLSVGAERERLAFLDTFALRLSRNISLHADLAPNDPKARDLAMTSILQRKGRLQDAMSDSLTALRQRSQPDDRMLIERLNEATTQLATLVLKGPVDLQPAEYQSRISALEAERDNDEDDLSRRSTGFYPRNAPVTLAAIRSAIPADAALVEFAVYAPFDPRVADNRRAYGKSRYVAYVLRNQGDLRWVQLGDAAVIDGMIEGMRTALRDPHRNDIRQRARALDEKLMRPVRALIGNATHLLVSPDGELNLLPFAALVDEQQKYLLERYNFTYLTSGRDLLRLQIPRASKSAALVVANPQFAEPAPVALAVRTAAGQPLVRNGKRTSVTTANELSALYFAPLNGTEIEARAIGKVFPDAIVLSGARATETALKKIESPRLLHIATHGFFLHDFADLPGSATPSVAASHARDSKSFEPRVNPLLRSGLALADANLRTSGADDGILTALEASGLDLWGTKLVVLSACD
ncbi:MAG: CHAT domain-containing tetratricopeptide repeat protein, partial [Pyrinomonadaceae bacterium]